jgi:hypothetical protein
MCHIVREVGSPARRQSPQEGRQRIGILLPIELEGWISCKAELLCFSNLIVLEIAQGTIVTVVNEFATLVFFSRLKQVPTRSRGDKNLAIALTSSVRDIIFLKSSKSRHPNIEVMTIALSPLLKTASIPALGVSAPRLTCGARLPRPYSDRASKHFYFPLAPPVTFRRASGTDRSSSPATGILSRAASAARHRWPGAWASAWGRSFDFCANPPPWPRCGTALPPIYWSRIPTFG